jgi:hypothetical protein
MNAHSTAGEQKVTGNVCAKRMKLHRRVSAPALGKGHEFQYWECVCGNVKVITGQAAQSGKVEHEPD